MGDDGLRPLPWDHGAAAATIRLAQEARQQVQQAMAERRWRVDLVAGHWRGPAARAFEPADEQVRRATVDVLDDLDALIWAVRREGARADAENRRRARLRRERDARLAAGCGS